MASGLLGLYWWIDRWRQSTAYTDLSLAEQGAYRNLLDEQWLRRGAIPNTDRILAKASGDATRWPAVRKAVLAHFTLTKAGWRNATLDAVLAQSIRRAENQANYRKRIAGRDNGHANGRDNATHNDRSNKPASQDQDSTYIPPNPPSTKGGRRRLTARERRRMAENAMLGATSCPHTPRCRRFADCTAKTIAAGRRRRKAAS